MINQKSMGQKAVTSQGTKFYLEQFDFESSRHLKILIAKFLDKKGIISWQNSQGEWIRPTELAMIDRKALAQAFVASRLKVSTMQELQEAGFNLKTDLTFEQFLVEVEKHIDLKLPLHYFAQVHQQTYGSRTQAKKLYPGSQHLKGFEFKYRVNYILDLRYVEKLKQNREADLLKQLKQMARRHHLSLKRHTLTSDEVRELLEAFQSQRLSEAQLKTYFISNQSYYSQARLEFDEFYA